MKAATGANTVGMPAKAGTLAKVEASNSIQEGRLQQGHHLHQGDSSRTARNSRKVASPYSRETSYMQQGHRMPDATDARNNVATSHNYEFSQK
jgi:hypothetical protein